MKTKSAELELFEKECCKWIALLNLNDFYWVFEEEELDGAWAHYIIEYPSMLVTLTLTTDFSEATDVVRKIKESAFHEVVEAGIFGLLKAAAIDKDHSQDAVESLTHAGVFRLQNLLFPIIED